MRTHVLGDSHFIYFILFFAFGRGPLGIAVEVDVDSRRAFRFRWAQCAGGTEL
jgi:hypothetical protein